VPSRMHLSKDPIAVILYKEVVESEKFAGDWTIEENEEEPASSIIGLQVKTKYSCSMLTPRMKAKT